MDSYENWDFTSFVDGYVNGPAFATWSGYAAYYDITIAPTDVWWHSNQTTTREDTAVFGEIDIKVTDRLSLLLGGRYYEVDRYISYFVEKPLGYPNNFTPDRTAVDDGFIPKVGFQYDVSDNMMVWSVYSEGYRVGGTNRARGTPTLPIEYGQDIIENFEVGLKSTWADDTIQFNATYYEMSWSDMQLELTDPAFSIGEPWQAVVANLGDGTVTGMDLDLKALIGNIQVGFNMTNIFDAYVNPMTEYPDARFEGGMADLGLEAKSSLPLFGDLSYSLYSEYSGSKCKLRYNLSNFKHIKPVRLTEIWITNSA
jgi:outer membrane receptor protein involved in Fe transport